MKTRRKQAKAMIALDRTMGHKEGSGLGAVCRGMKRSQKQTNQAKRRQFFTSMRYECVALTRPLSFCSSLTHPLTHSPSMAVGEQGNGNVSKQNMLILTLTFPCVRRGTGTERSTETLQGWAKSQRKQKENIHKRSKHSRGKYARLEYTLESAAQLGNFLQLLAKVVVFSNTIKTFVSYCYTL